MTVWNQPGPVGGGSPQPPRGVDSDGLPSLKVPRILTIAGVVTLLVGIGLFVTAVQTAPSVLEKNAVDVEDDGTPTALILLADTEYGFYSEDANTTCTVSDPADTVLDVYQPDHKSGQPPQVLGFRSTDAGTYTVACNGDATITINVSNVSPEWDSSARLALASIPFALAGAAITTGGAVWLILRRRKRSRMVVSRLFAPGHAGAPAFTAFPPDAGAVHPDATAPAPGAYASPQPPSAPSATMPPPATPAPPAANPPAPNSYGFAPQQVVYRPLTPPDGEQGS
ncbi:hypothetical protein GZ997_06500 [Actinomyces sp. 565]|uniref:hypothetical protein n=1 Tax=Actinomyces sp. 594 TaxID=2057793 RepID=UPI001C576C33|nr:hypothetical protein [Actinomyces sp. 594]NDR53715.1 hypothetical protein [Actinomyces sp. 565]